MLLIRRVIGFATVVFAVLPACGDSSGGTVSDSNSASGGSTSGATDATEGATEPTSSGSMSGSTTGEEGGNSDSLSGTTGDEGGNSDSLSGTVSSGVESDSMSGSGGTTSGGMTGTSGGESTGQVETSATDSTGEPLVCADLDNEAECMAAGCMPIKGRLFFDDGADLCLEAPSFLACAEQAACAEVITTVCKGAVQYQLPNACVPDGYKTCDAPFDPDMMFDECQ